MKTELKSVSVRDTAAAAVKLASELPLGSVVTLQGELGAGKTVFACAFARALGITERVSSPTFTIVQEYPYAKGILYHMDLYRIDSPESALAFGIDEYLCDRHGISLIEWPERMRGLFPKDTVGVLIERGETENERIITIEKPD